MVDVEVVRWPGIVRDGACVGCGQVHQAVYECLRDEHGLMRIDNWTQREARFQHGDNPEHTLMVSEEVYAEREQPCLGGVIDRWLSGVHARETS